MRYSIEFIDLQLQFAQHLSSVIQQPLSDVLFEHTVLRHILGITASDNENSDELWSAFVEELQSSADPARYVYNRYLGQRDVNLEHDKNEQLFGCFRYAYPFHEKPIVRLHFTNRDDSPHRVLSEERAETRRAELSALFRYVKRNHSDAKFVRGGSWLYNLPAYCQLFPPDYVRTAKEVGYETGFFALWGQFLCADGRIRQPQASKFLQSIREQIDMAGCLACFPFQVLRPECSIEVFYTFYGVDTIDIG